MYSITNLILGGLAFEMIISKFFNNTLEWDIRLTRSIVLGILWTTLFFGLAIVCIHLGFTPNYLWSIIFIIVTTVFFFIINKVYCFELSEYKFLKNSIKIILFALLLECGSVYFFPHVLDSIQLAWTNQFTDPYAIQSGKQTGAIAYSALIFFTGLIAPNLPLAISATSAKIVIFLLLGALIASITRIYYGTQQILALGIVGSLLLFSPTGVLSFTLGKDSLLGAVLGVYYIVLLGDSNYKSKFFNTALVAGVAVICGVISVPFIMVATVLAFTLIEKTKDKLNYIGIFMLVCGPLIAFPLSGMIHLSYFKIIFSSIALCLVAFIMTRISIVANLKMVKFSFWGLCVLLIITTIATTLLLPVIKVLPEFYGGDHGILSPLDGKTGFLGLIYNYSCNSGLALSVYLIAPFFALIVWRKRSADQWVPFIYLQFTIFLILLSCHLNQKILDPSNQNDLIKDAFGYFMMPTIAIMLGPVMLDIFGNAKLTRSLLFFIIIIFLGSAFECVAKSQMRSGFLYPNRLIGVFKVRKDCEEMGIISDYLWKLGDKATLLIDAATDFKSIGDIQYFCPRATIIQLEHNKITSYNTKYFKSSETFILSNFGTAQSLLNNQLQNGLLTNVLEIPSKNLVLLRCKNNN